MPVVPVQIGGGDAAATENTQDASNLIPAVHNISYREKVRRGEENRWGR